jgi:NADP-dependent 3-hydroxy acid dehydrogenase YdfG
MKANQKPTIIFITGASSGLGEALALHYGKHNVKLGLVGRNLLRLEDLKERLNIPCKIYVADVRNTELMCDVCTDFMSSFGVPDIVIANAGISHGTSTDFEEDTAVFKVIMETNLNGVLNTFQPFVSMMKEQGKGTLAAISSIAGLRGFPGAGAYCASKSALNTYMESLRVDLHGTGIKVISICPGHIHTPMTYNNPFLMPFIMESKVAAKNVAWHIKHSYGIVVTPWQMNLASRIFKHIPYQMWDKLFKSAPRKPRLSNAVKSQ